MSGAGNDFVVIDNRNGIIIDPSIFAQKVCDRRFGIGADGILLLEPAKSADFMMKYFNADGSNAGMCGNGGRCLAKFAYDIGAVHSERFRFEAFGHFYEAERFGANQYRLHMKDAGSLRIAEQVQLADGRNLAAHYINTGTDHSVVFIRENPGIGALGNADIVRIGREMRYHTVYQPIGANINFVEVLNDREIAVRTYERGVEDETLACGTGSVASAILSAIRYSVKSPVTVNVRSGLQLHVSFDRTENGFTNVHLAGPAVTVFHGEIDL